MTKAIKKVLAWSFAFVCAATAGIAAIATNGFGLGDPTAQVEQVDHNKQLAFGGFFGNGITLTASAEENAQASTPIFDSVVDDLGDISSNSSPSTASLPLVYQRTNQFEAQTVTKIGVPIKTVSYTNLDCVFTVRLVNVTTATDGSKWYEEVETHKLTVPGMTFDSTTVNDWYYFDTNIRVGKRQTLMFGDATDTVQTVVNEAGYSDYYVNTNALSGSTVSMKNLYLDIYTLSYQSGIAYLNANITPKTASIQDVDWSVAWNNPAAEWASGKTATDYVRIMPTEDGSTSAEVKCLQAFGEQIKVTVTSRDNPELTANCTLDYAKRIEKITFSLTSDGTDLHTTDEENITLNCNFSTELAMFTAHTTYEYSVGTVEDEFTLKGTMFNTVTEELLADMSAKAGYTYTLDDSYTDATGWNLTVKTKVSYMFRGNGYMLSIGAGTGQKALEALQKYVYEHPETSFFNIRLKAMGTYSTFEKEFEVLFNPDTLYIAAESVDVDQSAITL